MIDRTRPFAGQEGWQKGGFTVVPAERPGKQAAGGELPAPTNDLENVARLLELVLKELRRQVPQGVAFPVSINVPSAVPVPVYFPFPLFSLAVTNDGAGTVQYVLPFGTSNEWVSLNPTEVITFQSQVGVLASIGFRVLGAAANVRAVGFF